MSGLLLRVLLVVLAWDYFTADDGQAVALRFYEAASSNQFVQQLVEEFPVKVDIEIGHDI